MIRRSIAGQTIWLLGLAVMSMATTGCASRPYMQGGGGGSGEGSAAAVYLLPFILANEVALYAIEKKKQTAVEAREAELLSQVRRRMIRPNHGRIVRKIIITTSEIVLGRRVPQFG